MLADFNISREVKMWLFGIGSRVRVGDIDLTCTAIRDGYVVMNDGSQIEFKYIEACLNDR